ncbi:hypothetical protein NW754_000694 [Fusarium falciforme]|uniref:Integral membrane protein n=1 Tax=Fusarium falciforme TaxID=195108 RepID=A0A9W8R6I3_9HYPO|nr:Hypothetical protein NCS54_00226600 [Fusarium falciforme]KAJ4149256.1 hypothetical protein NW754_000694 [Fusarium falciforme]KAJ4187619.1 hypothetical protein NW755_007111 [Fusarium falciforme]KAJ4209848.1 hypothetical protein NW767_000125 [Fusarium falciforme]KAJ4255927.1 hypothetical protein NW757_004550 [Fusarium falciforme]WAO85033.1 Hypothetical protein NCS54_00226600 [Fusarium falciforme]
MAANENSPPETTIVPFNDRKVLPACAVSCGALYDANGACVPPIIAVDAGPSAYTQCFCLDTRVAAFSTATKGPCDDACTNDPNGLSSIAAWFRDICTVDENANKGNGNGNGQASSKTTTTDGSSSTGGSRVPANTGGGGDWISNHWQWVIMLVILVVGIAGIWIGACIWRRRYLRKKDRQSSLGQKHSGSASRPSWGPGIEASEAGGMPYNTGYDSNRDSNGMMLPGAGAAVVEEKPKKEKKRWIVRDRT